MHRAFFLWGVVVKPEDVERIQFEAVRVQRNDDDEDADDCMGCMFARQRFAVCTRALELAKLRGVPDCEEPPPGGRLYTYVYKRTPIDPRQMSFLEGD